MVRPPMVVAGTDSGMHGHAGAGVDVLSVTVPLAALLRISPCLLFG